MLRNRSITFKLIVLFSAVSAGIFVAVFSLYYYFTLRTIEKNVRGSAQNLAQSTVNRIETILSSVEKIPESNVYFLENKSYSKQDLLRILDTMVGNNPEIFGACVAFEPYAYDKKSLYFAPYCYEGEGGVLETWLGGPAYRYFYQDWYQIPKELGKPMWSEPYYDVGGGNILMATYSVPFYQTVKRVRTVRGIATVDISLEWLRTAVSSIKILKTGYGFLVSQNGTIVTHPSKELIMNATIFGAADSFHEPGLREIGRKMVRGESGFKHSKRLADGKPCWIYYAPIPSAGWSLGVVFPQDEYLEDIRWLTLLMAGLGLAGLLILLLAVVSVSQSITRPLRAVSRAAEIMATGNLDAQLPDVRSKDEIGTLVATFGYMKDSLKKYIRELTEATAARERVKSELKIAHDIQMNILPKEFPHRPEFELDARMQPAREVGGDFYDFGPVGENHYYFVIGDVSGKGMAAAIFMAMTKTLFKAASDEEFSPEKVMVRINVDLCAGNEESMFATVFLGVLDVRTGELVYSNAGHNVPLLLRPDATVSELENTRGTALGVDEKAAYEVRRMRLLPGETLLLYTDGVTEAVDAAGGFFGVPRLKEALAAAGGLSTKETVAGVLNAVRCFSGAAEQFDDITLLVFRYTG